MNEHGSFGRLFFGLFGLLAMSTLAACSGGGDGGGASAQAGTVSVSLTDAPACGFDEVNVTVRQVRIHQSDSADENGGGWTHITLDPPRRINLLELNDPTQDNLALHHLGETPLPAGHYTQLRLVLAPNTGGNPTANSVVLSDTKAEYPLHTPSAVQSGIKLIHQFTVGSGERVDLLLDFDACKSIVRAGLGTNKYLLKPVIKVIPSFLNGIAGFVDTALLGSDVVVTAQVNGDIVRATVPNANQDPNPNRGKFFLARLEPGLPYDVVITATGRATKVVSGVPVPTATSITPVSTKDNPFDLEPSGSSQTVSGTVTLNPPDDDGTVIVRARQSLTSGPTVTVRHHVATVLTDTAPPGDYGYELLLPLGRPWLGAYNSGSLPITFVEQPPAVGGIYAILSTAHTPTTGYTTQNPSPLQVDLTGGNQTGQNLTLTP